MWFDNGIQRGLPTNHCVRQLRSQAKFTAIDRNILSELVDQTDGEFFRLEVFIQNAKREFSCISG